MPPACRSGVGKHYFSELFQVDGVAGWVGREEALDGLMTRIACLARCFRLFGCPSGVDVPAEPCVT